MEKTLPRGGFADSTFDPSTLVAGRYGTREMCDIWGANNTFSYSLAAQAAAVSTLSGLYPSIIPPEDSEELVRKAKLGEYIDPKRIRDLEEKTGHDVIAINRAWGEVVSKRAASHINKARTSADTTETAKARQLKDSLVVYIDSLENLRDIVLEKSIEWIDIPFMDTTHLYDALPTVAGRPFSFYGEMLQSDLDFLGFVYKNSIYGKWADATGSHHSATALGIDGVKLQEEYCKGFGVKCMDAPAQIPGREFLADVIYGISRSAETMGNLARFIRMGRGDDAGLFFIESKKKASSAMPHKDAKGGNPTVEEQAGSLVNDMRGAVMTQLSACTFDYARDLTGSASDRIVLEKSFKFSDHVTRRLADRIYGIKINKERSEERIMRSYGVVTSQYVMNYLLDPRKVDKPMTRDRAHDLTGELATKAWNEKRQFIEVLLENNEIASLIPEDVLRKITNPLTYLGQSQEIVNLVFAKHHKKKTLS